MLVVSLLLILMMSQVSQVQALERIDAIHLNTLENTPYASVVDVANSYAYFGTFTIPAKVVKIHLSDFTRVGVITFPTGENLAAAAIIDPAAGYAYFGTMTSIVKVDLSTFTRVGAIVPGATFLYTAVIDTVHGYAYFGTLTDPGQIVKIDLSTFTLADTLTLPAGEGNFGSAVIDTSAGYAYFGTGSHPAKIVKINLSTFSREDAMTLDTGENEAGAAVIDVTAGYAYFGMNKMWPAEVVRISLSTFSRAGVLTFHTGEDMIRSAVISPSAGYALFGTYTTPGRVVSVRLADFSRAAAVTLNTGEDEVMSGIIDTTTDYSYFGTLTSPGWIVRVKDPLSSIITITSSPGTGSGFVTVDSIDYDTPHDFVWDIGTSHILTANSIVSCGAGCQYVWTDWSDSGDQTHTYTTPGLPDTVTANYKTQFEVSFTQTGAGVAPTVQYSIDSGSPVTDTVPFNVWVDKDSTISYTYEAIVSGGAGVQYVLTDTSPLPPQTVTAALPVSGTYKTQWKVTFFQSGVDSDFSGTVATIAGTDYDQAALITGVEVWVDDGDTVSFSFASPLSVASDKQYVWTDTVGLSTLQSETITVTADGTVTGNYKTQYYLTMQVNPPSSGSTSPVSTWADSGMTAWIMGIPVNGYMFSSWTGTGSGSYSGPTQIGQITLNGPITEIANFIPAGPVTMTVSYQVIGGTGYSAPIFNYVQGGINKQYTLTITPTGISVDGGTPWSVAPNPLIGSGSNVRWYSPQPLSGTGAAGTCLFSFQHQYSLIMQVNPLSAGSVAPGSSWQNAGAALQISAVTNVGYDFLSWIGSGTGSYSGNGNPAGITMNAPITEIANFEGTTVIAMTVNYAVVGGGTGYSAPVFHYTLNGVGRQYTLTNTPTPILCDSGTAWWVTTNPLSGSTGSERWYSGQEMIGTASTQDIVFSFCHQYLLTMQLSPSAGGTVMPGSSWQNTGSTVILSASPTTGYTFLTWTGSGVGSYTGTANPTVVLMNVPITEIAYFESHAPPYQCCLIAVNTSPLGLDNPYGGGAYVPNTRITISVNNVTGYAFQKWQRDGVDFTSSQTFQYTVDADRTFTAVFRSILGPVDILITSNPEGTGYVIVDGVPITTPQIYSWTMESVHTIEANSPVAGSTGVRYVWTGWSDSGTQSHVIAVPHVPTTYTANFQLQYSLTIAINPEGAGTTAPGVGQHWYDAGTVVQINTLPSSNYHFQSWMGTGSGSYTGTTNPTIVTMEAPITETTVLTQIPPVPPVSQCIIATAAYGSPMNPEVVYMRYVRDKMIGSTPIGSMLRDDWNWFYYLWSPPIAGVISTSPTLQALFRVLLLPLVGIIRTTGWMFTMLGSGDFAAVMAFTAAAVMSTAVYVLAPTMTVRWLWKRRYNSKR